MEKQGDTYDGPTVFVAPGAEHAAVPATDVVEVLAEVEVVREVVDVETDKSVEVEAEVVEEEEPEVVEVEVVKVAEEVESVKVEEETVVAEETTVSEEELEAAGEKLESEIVEVDATSEVVEREDELGVVDMVKESEVDESGGLVESDRAEVVEVEEEISGKLESEDALDITVEVVNVFGSAVPEETIEPDVVEVGNGNSLEVRLPVEEVVVLRSDGVDNDDIEEEAFVGPAGSAVAVELKL